MEQLNGKFQTGGTACLFLLKRCVFCLFPLLTTLTCLQGTRAAAQQGLTAGEISIEWRYLRYENEIEDNNSLYTTSGVCLERVWFLTTYGFLRLANEQGLAAMRHRGITGFYISTRRCSRYPELEKNMKHAYLAYYDRIQDIALFRLEDGDEFKHSVHLAQLGCPEMQPFDHVWSIGYVKRRDKEFEKFFNAFHEAVCAIVFYLPYRSIRCVFDVRLSMDLPRTRQLNDLKYLQPCPTLRISFIPDSVFLSLDW